MTGKGSVDLAQVTKAVGLRQEPYNSRIKAQLTGKAWLFAKNFYNLFPDKFKVSDSAGGTGGVVSLVTSIGTALPGRRLAGKQASSSK